MEGLVQPLVLFSLVVMFTQIDEVDGWLGCQEHQCVQEINFFLSPCAEPGRWNCAWMGESGDGPDVVAGTEVV